MKRLSVFFLGILLFGLSSSASALRIGVVDFREVNKETQFYKNAMKNYSMQFNTEREDLARLRKELNQQMAKINDEKNSVSDDEKAKIKIKADQIQKQITEAQRTLRDKMMTSRKNMTDGLLDKMQNVIKSIADQKKIDLVLHKQTVAYAEDMVDITNEVIGKLKKQQQ